MNRSKNIFLHFFDIHYLKEKGINEWSGSIYREASLATRLALLASDNVIIPASSYFESPLCRTIVDSYSDLHFLGLFKLVGNASSLTEFVKSKSIQYQFNHSTLQLYNEVSDNTPDIPFTKRQRSSTTDISNEWQNLLLTTDIKPLFNSSHGIIIPPDIEYLWNDTPKLLAGKPFIVENVFPIIFPDQNKNIFANNTLHSHINQYYFDSYTKEFNAGIVTDLVRLEPNYKIRGYDLSVPYKYIINELLLREKYNDIVKAPPEDIIRFKESDEWLDILISSIKKKESFSLDLKEITNSKIIIPNNNISTSTQININGDLIMGDNYSAGQVAAQGPNAQAKDITFNQIWNQTKNDVDLNQLAVELSKLRVELGNLASTPEHHIEIGHVASAEIEANSGNGAKAIELLAKAGKWSFNTATALGVAVAANAIKIATGQ